MILKYSAPLCSAACAAALLLSGCNKTPPAPAPGANMAAAPSSTAPVTAGSLPADTLVVPVNNPAGAPLPAPVSAGSMPANTYVVPATSANSAINQPSAAPPTQAAVAASTPATGSTSSASGTSSAAPVQRTPALVVPAGTRVTVVTNQSLSAEHSDPGAGFTGSLAYPIVVRGATVFARGTEVRGEITSAKGRGRFKGAGVLGIALTNIGGHSVDTSEYIQRDKGRGKRTAGFIGGGGGVGALIGGLAGGGKGALIGGLSGAGAGTAAGALTGSRDVVIPAESTVSFTTRSTITK